MSRILIIDSDPKARGEMKRTLELEGYDVDTAVSIAAARNKLNQRAYNLEIWNGSFTEGKTDGADEAVSRYAEGRNVLICSADPKSLGVADAHKAANITKPPNPIALSAAVRMLLEGRH